MAQKLYCWIKYGYTENNSKHINTKKTTFAYFEIVGCPHIQSKATEKTVKPYDIPAITFERVNTEDGVETFREEDQLNKKVGFVHPRRKADFDFFDYCIMIRDVEQYRRCVFDIRCKKQTNLDRRCDALIDDIWTALSQIEPLF